MDRFNTEDHSKLYAQVRPSTPDSVVNFVISYLSENRPATVSGTEPHWDVAVDVGCGSGQSTRVWSKYFSKVCGFDASLTQINEAKEFSDTPNNVEYAVSAAENLPIPEKSVDLLVVSQAMHWFDKPRFYAEAERVLRIGGVLAVYRYTDVDIIQDGRSLKSVYEMRDTHPCIRPYMSSSVRQEQDMALRDLVFPQSFIDRRRGDKLLYAFPAEMNNFLSLVQSRSAFTEMKKADEVAAAKYLQETTDAAKQICGIFEDEKFLKLPIRMEFYYAVEIGRLLDKE